MAEQLPDSPVDNSTSDPQPDEQPSRWRRVATALGRAALAPWNTAGYLYRTGQENRHFTLPVLNGAFGDQLAARHDRRAIQMSFRRHGADLSVAQLRLHPHPDGRPRTTVVFVHGLMGDEVIWQTGAAGGGLRYGPRLQQDTGATCLYVRYNTGLHISQNGQQLNHLLAELLATYPDAIGDLALVGHSMGGLVIRSASYYATKNQESRIKDQGDNTEPVATEAASTAPTPNSTSGSRPAGRKPAASSPAHHSSTPPQNWLTHLRDVFLLGVPNDGSFLEQNSHLTSVVLRKINLRPTRFVSGIIDGIRAAARVVEKVANAPHAAPKMRAG